MNLTRTHEVAGLIPGLSQRIKDPVLPWAGGVGHRHGSDPALPWLWCRLTVAALIQPLAWELLYATGAALKKKQKKKRIFTEKIRKTSLQFFFFCIFLFWFCYQGCTGLKGWTGKNSHFFSFWNCLSLRWFLPWIIDIGCIHLGLWFLCGKTVNNQFNFFKV